jgi:murein DD-endopeptidase MepM/ murein hydrolase activator NlpD
VKLFDPESESIFYYSHLDSVFVHAGQIVNAGEKLAYVGRTGRKAFRGKTHLHIAYYKIEDGYPKPVDIIEDLYSAERRNE